MLKHPTRPDLDALAAMDRLAAVQFGKTREPIGQEIRELLACAFPQLDADLSPGPSVRRVKRLAEVIEDGRPGIAQLVTLAAAAIAAAEAIRRHHQSVLVSTAAINAGS